MMWAISRTRSSRSIHDIHCRPLPIGPPRPNSNGISSRLSIRPRMPSTRPMRSRTTRTPSRCAFLASRSQASQTRWVKQRLPPSNSVSGLVLPQTVPADGGAADQHRGVRSQARDQADDGARHAQPRRRILRRLRRVQSPSPIGSPARLITTSIRASFGICARLGNQPERRTQRRGLRRIARQHGDIVSGAGQRLDQPPPDEAGRAGDEHVLPRPAALDQRRRVARVAAVSYAPRKRASPRMRPRARRRPRG